MASIWYAPTKRRKLTRIFLREQSSHHDHEPRVQFEEQMQARFTRYAIVRPEVALSVGHIVVARISLEHH